MPTNVKITDDEILQTLQPDIDKARQMQDTLADQRQDYYRRYRGEKYGNERDGWSQSVAPVIANNLRSTLPTLMEIFHEEYFTLKSDNEERANNFQKLIYYQMFRKQDGFRQAYDFIYDALIYHYAIFKVYYKEDFDLESEVIPRLSADEMMQLVQQPGVTVTKYTEAQDDGTGETAYENVKVSRKVTLYAGPYKEVVPPWEFYYSPDCKIGDMGSVEGRLVFHEYNITMNDIRKRERAEIYKKGTYDKVMEYGDEPDRPSMKPDSFEILIGVDDISEIDDQANTDNELSRRKKMRECYCRLDIDGDGLLEHCIVDLCGDVVCRVEENPYRRPPFRIGSVHPEAHKITGISDAEILDNDQRIMTNLMRLIQDSAAQSCYRNPVTSDTQMFEMLKDRKPFAAIKGPPDKLGEVKLSPPDQFILKAYQLMKDEVEEETGVTKYNQGRDAASLNKTATGISAIFSASEKRIRLVAALLGNGPMRGLVRDFIFINQKWPSEDPVKLLGQGIEINQGDLDGEYEIEIDIGTSPSEKQAVANQMDLFIQFATQAGINMGIMTPAHVIRAQKKKYRVLGIKMDDCMKTEQQWMQEQQQQMMAQQQAAQQQIGPPGMPPPMQGGPPPQLEEPGNGAAGTVQ